MHSTDANTIGSVGDAPGKFWKFPLSEIESESSFSGYFTFQADLYNIVRVYIHGQANNVICAITQPGCSQLSFTQTHEQIIMLNQVIVYQ